jgi:uncharacterized protein (TIGR02266 family)
VGRSEARGFVDTLAKTLIKSESQMGANGSPEHRRHPRVDVHLQVKIRFADMQRFLTVTTKNLSEGGLFVACDQPKPVGTSVQVVLYPPGLELGLPVYGTVIHSISAEDAAATGRRAGMGIRFDDLDEDARASLARLVQAVASEVHVAPSLAPPRPTPPPPPRRTAEGEERRISDRVPARTLVRLRFADVQLFREFYTKDLSRGGVFVCTPQPLPTGTEVELLLTPPQSGEATIALEGRVAHVVAPAPASPGTSPGMGIEFTALTLEKRAEIARYVDALAAQRTTEKLGRVRPMPTAQIRFDSPVDFLRMVRGELRRRQLFVESEDPRPVGTLLRVHLLGPHLAEPIELHGEVTSAVSPAEATQKGLRSGMHLRLTDLTDEFLADIERALTRSGTTAAASTPPPVTGKAAMLVEAALEDLKNGKRSSAVANLKLALSFDPGNAYCKRLLDDVLNPK